MQHDQHITTIHDCDDNGGGNDDDDNVQNHGSNNYNIHHHNGNNSVVNSDSDCNNSNFICFTKMVLLWSCGFTALLTFLLVWVVRNYVLS